jgi:hypothetical protein
VSFFHGGVKYKLVIPHDDLGNYVVMMLGPKLFCIHQEYFRNSTNHDLKKSSKHITPNLIPWWVGFIVHTNPKSGWDYILKSEGKLTFLMLWEVNIQLLTQGSNGVLSLYVKWLFVTLQRVLLDV